MLEKPKGWKCGLDSQYKGCFEKVLTERNITKFTSPRYTPARNGSAEQAIGAVAGVTRANIIDANAPPEMWDKAM